MKNVLIALAIFSLLFVGSILAPLIFVHAQAQDYFLVESEDLLFYNESNQPMFIIPKTYYVLKTGEQFQGNYYYVSYKNIDGRLLKSSVAAAQSLNVDSPFFSSTLQINSSESFILVHNIPSSTASEKLFFDDLAMNFEFIGIMPDTDSAKSDIWYYVRYNTDRYGYIHSTKTSNTTLATSITAHPNSLISPSPSPSISPSPNPNAPVEPTNDMLRVLLILGISVPAVIIVFLLFRPSSKTSRRPPRERSRDYYDDYEDDYYEDDYYDNYRDRREYRDPRYRR